MTREEVVKLAKEALAHKHKPYTCEAGYELEHPHCKRCGAMAHQLCRERMENPVVQMEFYALSVAEHIVKMDEELKSDSI